LRIRALRAFYADDIISSGSILLKIEEAIITGEFGIYDVTDNRNPNVFLELGLAMSAQLPYYIICRSGAHIPTDIAGHDRIEYHSYLDLERKLKQYVRSRSIPNADAFRSSEPAFRRPVLVGRGPGVLPLWCGVFGRSQEAAVLPRWQ